MPRTQKGSNRSSNQGPRQAKGKNQPKQPKNSQTRKSAPLAKGSKGNGMLQPRESRAPSGSRSIFFEEYVQDVPGSVAFSGTSYPVQPGVSTLFAWLATQAISYQEYRVKSLSFRFESEKDATKAGKLMMSFLPDPSDAVPASKQEMLENKVKAKCKTWEDVTLRVPPECLSRGALGDRRFIRSGTLAANLDIKLYDVGQLIVATQGQADTTDIGELYVIYEIELMTPVISLAAIAKATSAAITGSGSVSVTSIFGSAATVSGGLDVDAATMTLTWNRVGSYFVSMFLTGTGMDTSFVPVLTGTATNSTPTGNSNAAADAGTSARCTFLVVVAARGQTTIVDLTGVATTVSASATNIAAYSVA